MDQVMVDVTDLPDVKEGDTAVLFGDDDITADEAAGWLNTINYEVTCPFHRAYRASTRVDRIPFLKS